MNRLMQKTQKARNFARAFLRTHDMQEADLFSGIDKLMQCCLKTPLVFYTLELSSARLEDKYAVVDQLSKTLEIPPPLTELLHAVLRYKEFHLLLALLEVLKEEFRKMHGIHEVIVRTSHPLQPEQRAEIEALVKTKIPGTLRFNYRQDQALIAGIKIETPLYYWEHSVAKTLRDLEQNISSQECL